MESSLKIEQLLNKFKHQGIFATKDVRNFYAKKEEKVSDSTINWRIHQLLKSGVISKVGRGQYKVGASSDFRPQLGKREASISNQIKRQFPFIEYCIWNTTVVNEFSLHQSFVNFLIVETEKDSLEAVFHYLKERHDKVYLKPKREIVENYLLEMKQVIVVQHLVSEAPLQEVQKMPTITLEKLLVDLVHGKDLFYFYQGYELQHIFQRAFEKYTINESKLLRYADRRQKKAKILKIINASFEDLLGDKLTAFAPETTGIPYEKGGQSKAMEIIKQLYDIGNIFDRAEHLKIVSATFKKFALTELSYRGMEGNPQLVLEDIFQTALSISTRGKEGNANFAALQQGISQIKAFIFSENYHIEKAITHAAKAAYLVKLIEHGKASPEQFNDPLQIKDWVIEQPFYTKLNKLKKSNPEAFFYWYKAYLLAKPPTG